MKMKIIGGPHDGQEAEVRKEQPFIIKLVAEKHPNRPYGAMPECASTVRQEIYTARSLRWPDGKTLHFLAPVDWSDFKAVEFQFKK